MWKRNEFWMKKIVALLQQYRSMIVYLVLGGMTTLVNMAVYYGCYKVWGIGSDPATILAWIVAVVFAFLTNKPWAFDSHDWSLKTVLPEAGRFLECRVGTGIIELVMMHVSVEMLGWPAIPMKLLVSVIVVVLNYIGSRLMVFRNRK